MDKQFMLMREGLALEMMSSGPINVIEVAKRIFPALSQHFKSFVSGLSFDVKTPESLLLSSNEAAFVKLLGNHRYLDLVNLLAYTPEGLNTDYIDYLNKLEPVAMYTLQARDRMNDFSTQLAVLLTTKDALRSTKSDSKSFAIMQEARDNFSKDLGKCMKANSHQTESTYGKVIARNNDWPIVFKKMNDIGKAMETIDRRKLLEKVKEISGYIDRLDAMRRRGELDEISPEMISEIADGAFQIASELEFFAITYYRVQAIRNAIEGTVDHLNNVLK